MNHPIRKFLITLAACTVLQSPARAEVTGQWDFDGDLSATIGKPMEFYDGPGGATEQGTEFGTTASFGIPDIDGEPASVMKMPANDSAMGYLMRPDMAANGGGISVNQWSLVVDLLYPADSTGQPRAIIQIDDPFPFGNGNAAEALIDANNGVGALVGHGEIQADTWHRLVLVVDQVADPPVMTKYIDGLRVGQEVLPVNAAIGRIDGRWAIFDNIDAFGALLFTDNAGNSEIGYVNSVQIIDTNVSAGYVAALGGPSAEGIPAEVRVIAALESISPAPDQSNVLPETPIEVILSDGDLPVSPDTIVLTLNGEAVDAVIDSSNPGQHVVTHDPGLLEPGSEQTVTFRFIDSSNDDQESVTEWSFTMAPYHLPPIDLSLGSLLYLPFDEPTASNGDSVMDLSNSENHGVLVLAEDAGDRKVEGIIGGAINFFPDDPADYNHIELSKPYGLPPNSYSCWVKISADFPSGRVGVTVGNWPTTENVNWEVHADGKPRIYWNNGQVNWIVEDDVRTGEWEHFAFVRDASKGLFSYYRNGQLHSTLSADGTTEVSPEAFPFVGADHRGAAQTFKGQIDEVVIYNRVLTAADVFRIYANAFDFPDFQFTSPPIVSVFPVEDDFNVAVDAVIEVRIDESNSLTLVVDDSVVLTINDTVVDGTLTREDGLVTVRHAFPSAFAPGEMIAASITYVDTGGIETSKTWRFTTVPEPTIRTQPLSASVFAGSATTFSVEVDTVPPTTYQWRLNGNPIPGGTERTLSLLDVQPVDAGNYDVVITDAGGSVTSSIAVLTVLVEILPDDPAESLPIGLAAAWPFDEDFESLIPGFDGVPINGAEISSDATVGAGAASFFQAQEQYVDVDARVIADGSFAYTAAGWFKVTGGTGRRFLWETSDTNWAISAEVTPESNVKAFARLADGSSHSSDTGLPPGLDEWHHVAVTFDGVAGEAAIFYDGEKVDSAWDPPFEPGVGTAETVGFHIGSFRGGNGRFFEGLIDDVGVWTRVLREDEIAYLAAGNAIPQPDPSKTLTQGQQANWHFDEDFSSFTSEFDGEPINGASISGDAAVGSGSVSFSQAAEQYVDVDRQVISDGALAYSAAGWFKVTGGEGRRFLWETSDTNWAISAEVTPAGSVKGFTRLADTSSHSADTGVVPALDEWHHVVVTFDGLAAVAAIYYDGVRVDVPWEPPFEPGVGTAETVGFHIGSYRAGTGRFFEGLIDDVGIWDRVLTEREVAYLAGGNAIPNPPTLPKNPSPLIVAVSPEEDAIGVSIDASIEIQIDESNSENLVNQDSIVLTVNGGGVDPTVTSEGGQLFVRYTPTTTFQLGETVEVTFDYEDTGGNAFSTTWSFLTTPPVPAIDGDPESLTVHAGSTAAFSVGVNLPPPFMYQWRYNGADILNATGPTLTLRNVQPGQAGEFDVVITNASGTATSNPATLTVVDNLLSDDPTISLGAGLAAAWPFDADFTSLVAGFDGEPINGASISDDAAVGGGAVSLGQAEQQYVDIAAQVIANGSLSYSVAGWYKVAGGSGRRFLWETSPANWAISAEVTPDGNLKAFARLADASSHSADTGMQPGLGEWHHVAVTFDGAAGEGAIYFDGTPVDVAWDPAFPVFVGTADTEGFHIGSFRGGSDRFFDGLIDDVGVWNRVLSAAEVEHLSAGNAIPVPDASQSLLIGQVANWHFDDDFTSSPAGYDGEPINGAALSGDAMVGSGSVSLSQTESQYVDVDRQVLFDGALSYSAAGWFKVTGGEGRRFLWETSDSNWAISAEVTPDGNLKAFARLEDGSSHSLDTGFQPPLGEWHHLAVTFDGAAGGGAVYVDGELVDLPWDPAFPPGVGTAPTVGFHIGSYRAGSARFFEGLIDEVGIWDRVLTAAEVGFLADGNAIPDPSDFPAGAPVIRAIQISGGNLRIEWEGGEPPYQIQSRTSLTEGVWEDVGDPTGETSFEEAIGEAMKFFQIVQP